jgi:hypothetical protein
MVSPPLHAMEGWLERLSEQTGWLFLTKKISNSEATRHKTILQLMVYKSSTTPAVCRVRHQHPLHCMQWRGNYIFLIYITFFTLHSSLFTLHSSLFTLHSSLFTLHSSLFIFNLSLPHAGNKKSNRG